MMLNEIVKSLRICNTSNCWDCEGCAYTDRPECRKRLMIDAADALETAANVIAAMPKKEDQ